MSRSKRTMSIRGRVSLDDKRALAGFRCGNWFRASEFWRGDEERACSICGMEEETIWHILRGCRGLMFEEEIGLNKIMCGNGGG